MSLILFLFSRYHVDLAYAAFVTFAYVHKYQMLRERGLMFATLSEALDQNISG
jgi:hypothetical protein